MAEVNHTDSATVHMKSAICEAQKAADRGESPVGAVLVDAKGNVLSNDGNRSIELNDPSAHAEMQVIRKAASITGNYRLTGSTLYVTLEPCLMCAGAMIHARIKRLVFGALDPKAGAVVSMFEIGTDQRLNHTIEIQSGLLAEESSQLLKDFFKSKRNAGNTK